MLARNYDKRITFYQTSESPDGYGGFVVSNLEISKQWARIDTFNSTRYIDEGLQVNEPKLKVFLRYRKDLILKADIHFFFYKGKKYVIENIVNHDLRDLDIEIICNGKD